MNPHPILPRPASLSRRDFLAGGLTVGALLSASHAGAGEPVPKPAGPHERLNLAFVGTQGRAWDDIMGCIQENPIALCDVDERSLNRAAQQLQANHGKARPVLYRDYREMLDKEARHIDALVVATSDHSHAPPAAVAMRLGKHVYCEKPLTHTVEEARLLAQLAAKHRVATQMGTQIHAEGNYRRVVELIRAGAIGEVSEVYTWVSKGWADGRFAAASPAPAHLDWDLWLGPARERPHSPGIHPANWRRFWEYGGGTLGDMGCHIIDVVFWALGLSHCDAVWAEGPAPHPDGCPSGLRAHWHFPAGENAGRPRRDLTLHWSDSGNHPDILKETVVNGRPLATWGIGALFIGDRGKLVCDYGGLWLLPENEFKDFIRPQPSIPNSMGHHREWLHACRTGAPTTCHFGYSGPLTETVLLGNVAFRAGKRLTWDSAQLRCPGAPETQALIAKEYRKGWDLVRS